MRVEKFNKMPSIIIKIPFFHWIHKGTKQSVPVDSVITFTDTISLQTVFGILKLFKKCKHMMHSILAQMEWYVLLYFPLKITLILLYMKKLFQIYKIF